MSSFAFSSNEPIDSFCVQFIYPPSDFKIFLEELDSFLECSSSNLGLMLRWAISVHKRVSCMRVEST